MTGYCWSGPVQARNWRRTADKMNFQLSHMKRKPLPQKNIQTMLFFVWLNWLANLEHLWNKISPPQKNMSWWYIYRVNPQKTLQTGPIVGSNWPMNFLVKCGLTRPKTSMMVAFLVSGNPRLFQGNQGRWNIMIIYDIYTLAGYVLFCIDPIISHMLHFFLQMLLPFSFHLWFSCPKGSMGLVYLPTFTIKNHPNVFRYTIRGWYGCRVKKIRWSVGGHGAPQLAGQQLHCAFLWHRASLAGAAWDWGPLGREGRDSGVGRLETSWKTFQSPWDPCIVYLPTFTITIN